MAQHQTIRGLSFEGITGIKRDRQSARDKAIANLPRLHLLVDPSRLSADGQGNEAMIAAPLGPVSVEVEPSALFDGRPVIKQNNAADKIVINMEGLGKQSPSFVTEVVGDASIHTTTAELFHCLHQEQILFIRCAPLHQARACDFIRIQRARHSTRLQTLYSRRVCAICSACHGIRPQTRRASSSTTANTVVHSPAPSTPITAAMKYAVGNRLVGMSLGWRGEIGTSLIFDALLYLPAYTWIRQQAFNALNMVG